MSFVQFLFSIKLRYMESSVPSIHFRKSYPIQSHLNEFLLIFIHSFICISHCSQKTSAYVNVVYGCVGLLSETQFEVLFTAVLTTHLTAPIKFPK